MTLRRFKHRGFVLLAAGSLLVAACGSDDDSSSDTSAAATETTAAEAAETTAEAADTTAAAETEDTTEAADTTVAAESGGGDLEALGLWDDGPCDDSLEPLKLGLQTVFQSGVLTLQDQAQALEAAAEAFNARGGANNHCIEVITCDDGADPNKALECVRTLDDAGISATINDTTSVASADVAAGYAAAGIARFGISPGQDDYGNTNTYAFTAGGTGTSIMMPQGLLDQGITKIAIVRVDLPAATALKGFLEAIYADNGAEFVADLPVPAGTTDYSQFILAAQDAGAEGIVMPLGGQEAIQVVRAGEQLGAELKYSSSLGSFPPSDIADLGEYGANMVLNEGIPPATFDDPVVDVLTADLAASDVEALQRDNLKASPMRSWIGLYALLYILREAGTEDFSRENVTSLINAAKDIPMLGLTGDWTPNLDHEGVWLRTGNGFYSFWSYGADGFEKVSEANFDTTICGSGFGGECK